MDAAPQRRRPWTPQDFNEAAAKLCELERLVEEQRTAIADAVFWDGEQHKTVTTSLYQFTLNGTDKVTIAKVAA
jgi:hypothetical protein